MAVAAAQCQQVFASSSVVRYDPSFEQGLDNNNACFRRFHNPKQFFVPKSSKKPKRHQNQYKQLAPCKCRLVFVRR